MNRLSIEDIVAKIKAHLEAEGREEIRLTDLELWVAPQGMAYLKDLYSGIPGVSLFDPYTNPTIEGMRTRSKSGIHPNYLIVRVPKKANNREFDNVTFKLWEEGVPDE